ncbi:MAG: exosortase H-associated membrane protein [Casimicrobiaceae bacterium]
MLRSPVSRFILRVLGWLPVAFAVWYFAAPLLVLPAGWLVQAVSHVGFGDLVRNVEQVRSTFTFTTTLLPGRVLSGAAVTVEVNALLYAFGLPLFVALTLAAGEPRWWRTLAIGYVALLPVIAWGTLADFLKNIAITSGPAIASQTGFSGGQREIIAFAFQFGSLILPTVVPAVVWVVTHRKFLTQRIYRGRAA